MKKYIDTDTAYEVLTEYYHHKTEAQHEALREALDRVPAADVVEVRHYLSEWCTDCKEYDKERHCCPRFNRVIEETVAEMKSDGWQKVRHGRWEETTTEDPCYYRCSECGRQTDDEYNYCPNCGASMVNEECEDESR